MRAVTGIPTRAWFAEQERKVLPLAPFTRMALFGESPPDPL